MRLRNFIFGLILAFIIGAIIYEVVKPAKQIQEEYNHMMDELFNSLAP